MKEDDVAFPIQETTVQEIIFHPDYVPEKIHYNLAILVTERNFVYKQHIGPACLPSPDDRFDGDKDCWSRYVFLMRGL